MSKKKNGKSYKKYFMEGKLAKLKGLLLEDNPYDYDESVAWEDGWNSVPDIPDEEYSGC